MDIRLGRPRPQRVRAQLRMGPVLAPYSASLRMMSYSYSYFHINVYQTKQHSYRDLPIRYAELGTVYRYER